MPLPVVNIICYAVCKPVQSCTRYCSRRLIPSKRNAVRPSTSTSSLSTELDKLRTSNLWNFHSRSAYNRQCGETTQTSLCDVAGSCSFHCDGVRISQTLTNSGAIGSSRSAPDLITLSTVQTTIWGTDQMPGMLQSVCQTLSRLK